MAKETNEFTQQESDIKSLVQKQREFFSAGATSDSSWRIRQLKKLCAAIRASEKDIFAALSEDLGKAEFESFCTEERFVLEEIRCQIRNVKRWSRPVFRFGEVQSFPSTYRILHEPFGVTLIVSPWNYPFLLSLVPLIDAIAAGNTAILKTSEYSPASSALIKKIISENFEPSYISVLDGGYVQNQLLLQQHFDFIFFTGSPAVGKIVMEQAARNLTPVCLELGGKSPCIVDSSAKIQQAAKRIVWGKLINAGQTCVAPDYILVHESQKEELVKSLKEQIAAQYGDAPLANSDYPRIINKKHFNRLLSLAPQAQIDPNSNKIAPTIVDLGSIANTESIQNHPLMKEEIFGPILPVITFSQIDEAVAFVKSRPAPLALYLFSTDKASQKRIMGGIQFGGGCVNDVIMHIASSKLPFGGVGFSGIGQYHGKFGFETFSHVKGVVIHAAGAELSPRYAPYKKKTRLIKLMRILHL